MLNPEPNPLTEHVITQVQGRTGLITLNRPKALNALSLPMIRALTATLLAWRDDAGIDLVAIRGQGKDVAYPGVGSPFGAFCAGGDILFFHQTAMQGGVGMEDFFTEEYALNHLIHGYPKPFVAVMDGIVFGGGMGISQGAGLRIVTERTKMAMPETNIGLFPDVGGGYFLSRCPGRVGEYLALTGQQLQADDAIAVGLADVKFPSAQLPALWQDLANRGLAALHDVQPGPTLGSAPNASAGNLAQTPSARADAGEPATAALADSEENAILAAARAQIDYFFGLESLTAMVQALERDPKPWATQAAADLRKRSPLMLHVALEQVRRGRQMSLADDLRMERGMMRHCFHLRPGVASETVEGIRALAVDKDQQPRWNPSSIEAVTPAQVSAFFESPWPAHAHPLKHLN